MEYLVYREIGGLEVRHPQLELVQHNVEDDDRVAEEVGVLLLQVK